MNPNDVLHDAELAVRASETYRDLVAQGLTDGKLRKAMDWALTGFVGPAEPAVKDYTKESIVAFMRHMGELSVPLWVLGVSKTANMYLRDLIRESQKILEKERKKRSRTEDLVKSEERPSKVLKKTEDSVERGSLGLKAWTSDDSDEIL